jgi:hypothetical protein
MAFVEVCRGDQGYSRDTIADIHEAGRIQALCSQTPSCSSCPCGEQDAECEHWNAGGSTLLAPMNTASMPIPKAWYAKIAQRTSQIRHNLFNGLQQKSQFSHIFPYEFRSLLLRENSFWVDPWTNHHPKDCKYLDDFYDDWKEVEKVRVTITDDVFFQKGFVSNYGVTNFNNDFSEYSAMIFTHPQKFKEIMNQYPRVRGKFEVWLEFYQKIDPIFSQAYFLGE